jgi:hypothetical protein
MLLERDLELVDMQSFRLFVEGNAKNSSAWRRLSLGFEAPDAWDLFQ